MNAKILACAIATLAAVGSVNAQSRPPRDQEPPGQVPADQPPRDQRARGSAPKERGGERRSPQQRYSIEQAISDKAQLHTIAFSGLAFVTGDFGASTFLPPGKVCDYFGFQYMRDIDASQKGHNPMFLDRITANVLQTLTPEQRGILEKLAREQAPQYQQLAEKRWPLIRAFCRELNGEAPQGLSKDAVVAYVGDIFAMDAEMSYRRAEVVGGIVASFTPEQRATLAKLKFGDFSTWPAVDMQAYKLPRGTEKLVNVAYMTYASELFSWYAGSVEADTYFCPERHGTYFGGFYMKDMPAMGKKDFDISTSVTGDSGGEFLRLLTPEQRQPIADIPAKQRGAMREIVDTRRAISIELRKFMEGKTPDKAKVLALGRRYGELDGELSYMYATAFAHANRTLTKEQRGAMMKLRNLDGYTSAPAYIYSSEVKELGTPINTDAFFAPVVEKAPGVTTGSTRGTPPGAGSIQEPAK